MRIEIRTPREGDIEVGIALMVNYDAFVSDERYRNYVVNGMARAVDLKLKESLNV